MLWHVGVYSPRLTVCFSTSTGAGSLFVGNHDAVRRISRVSSTAYDDEDEDEDDGDDDDDDSDDDGDDDNDVLALAHSPKSSPWSRKG